MAYTELDYVVDGQVGVITLQRPEAGLRVALGPEGDQLDLETREPTHVGR